MAQKLPKPLSYDVTQAQLRLEGLFNHPIAIVFTFITVVALQPLIQELIYRHLIIHELGKAEFDGSYCIEYSDRSKCTGI